MNHKYIIGGSPCSGKSTVAEALTEKRGFYYYKVDDFLDEYAGLGAADGKPICVKLRDMTPEQIWMRDPEIQCLEEIQFYHEIFEYVMKAVSEISSENGIIMEGAAFLPDLIAGPGMNRKYYVNLTPTPEFQIHHFEQRPFIKDILNGCRDEKKAFMNWMERDILFAESVRRQSKELGFRTIVNDGTIPIEELVNMVSQHFSIDNH